MRIYFSLWILAEAKELIVSYPSNGDFSRRTSRLTATQAEQITSEHNHYRRLQVQICLFSKITENQNASDMNKMIWDQDLADAAQEYVESCELGF